MSLLILIYPYPYHINIDTMLLATKLSRFFSSKLSVPIVDVTNFVKGIGNCEQECKTVAEALHKYGCLVIKDPRVDVAQNNRFLDMMEKFFQKRSEDYYAGRPVADVFPEHDFQIGATPEKAERARPHHETISTYTKKNKADTPQPPPHDSKWRYFWNIGDVSKEVIPNKPPKDFPEWQVTANAWGQHMIDGCNTVSEMAALGLGLERKTFSSLLKRAPHKLAPTGSDLTRYEVGTVFAGFHYDFNFLTIHGKSRYPGLFAWLRNGQKFSVSVPEGHLLLQAGKQFEMLTGGYITCGFHEVIYTKQVQAKKNEAIKQGRIPWRVSSTLFSHVAYDVVLQPIGKFLTPETQKKYPPITGKQQQIQELQAINLKRS